MSQKLFNYISEELNNTPLQTQMVDIIKISSYELTVCTGCGRLSCDEIGRSYLACCPDNNYIPIRDYFNKSKYERK